MTTRTENAIEYPLRPAPEMQCSFSYNPATTVARIAGKIATKTFATDTDNLQVQLRTLHARGCVPATGGHATCTPMCNSFLRPLSGSVHLFADGAPIRRQVIGATRALYEGSLGRGPQGTR